MAVINFNEELSSNAPLSVSLFTKIQKDILSGSLKAGSKLSEQSICERYNVSRTPVREALRQLEKEGLIENIPNRGAFVLKLSNQEIDDLFKLRLIYEQQALTWAIERMNKEDIENLQEIFGFMEFYTQRRDLAKMEVINPRFHKAIYGFSRNKMLYRSLSSYQQYMQYTGAEKYYEDDLDDILLEHRAIYEAILARNQYLAHEAMKAHIDKTRERYLSKRNEKD